MLIKDTMKIAAKTAVMNRISVYQYVLFILTVAVLYLLSDAPAYAFVNSLCNAVDFANGNLSKGIASAGVISLGVGATMGKVSWGMAATVATGIAVMFGYTGVVTNLGYGSC